MSILGKFPKDNTVILNKFIVGQYHDEELDEMVEKLAAYYLVSKEEFVITKKNPFGTDLIN